MSLLSQAVGIWTSLFPINANDDIHVLELGWWSRLSRAPKVKTPEEIVSYWSSSVTLSQEMLKPSL